MKLKTCLIATSALCAPAFAFAADTPPMIAEPVEYVQACDSAGTAYFQVPGAATCIKLSGNVAASLGGKTASMTAEVTDEQGDEAEVSHTEKKDREFEATGSASADLTLQSFTNTEMGILKTYLGGTYSWNLDGTSDNWKSKNAYLVFDGDTMDLTAGYTTSLVDGPLIGKKAMLANAEFDVGSGFTFGVGTQYGSAYGGPDNKFDFVSTANYSNSGATTSIAAAIHMLDGNPFEQELMHSFAADDIPIPGIPDETYTMTGNVSTDTQPMGFAIGAKQEFTVTSLSDETTFYIGGRYGKGATAYLTGENPWSDSVGYEYGFVDDEAAGPKLQTLLKGNYGALDSLGTTVAYVESGFETELVDGITFNLDGHYTNMNAATKFSYEPTFTMGSESLEAVKVAVTGTSDATATIYGFDTGISFDVTDNLTFGLNGGWSQADTDIKVGLNKVDVTITPDATDPDFKLIKPIGGKLSAKSNTMTLGADLTYAFSDAADFTLAGEYSKTDTTAKLTADGENIGSYKRSEDEAMLKGTFTFKF